jgi:hypothetical protein
LVVLIGQCLNLEIKNGGSTATQSIIGMGESSCHRLLEDKILGEVVSSLALNTNNDKQRGTISWRYEI